MSSIIDALKKSDAKRPRKKHGMNIRMDLKDQSPSKNRRGFYAIIVALILTLAAVYFQKPDFVWQHLGSAEQPVVSKSSPDKTTPAKEHNKKLTKPAPKQVQSVAQEQSAQSIADNTPDQTIPPESTKNQPMVARNNQDNAVTQDNVQPDQEISESTRTEPQVQQQIDEQLAATPMKNKQAIDAPLEDEDQPESDNKLPQLFELPYSVRKEVPKITLSVHIYDPVVENRMAIVNGVPVHVGDTLEGSITIQNIIQSGVVLRIQDRDFIVLK